MSSFTLDTPHGLISVTDTALKTSTPTLLLLHGNSSSSKIWRHIFDSPHITQKYRVVAFDLPGHGASSNAPDPETTYCMRGYAELAVQVLQHLNIERVVIVGWSLGGHVGIEMVGLLSSSAAGYDSASAVEVSGLMIIGTPPARGKEEIGRGFKFQDAHLGVAAKVDWTDEEAGAFARESAPRGKEELFEPWMEVDAKRTDGRSRMMMWKRFAAEQGDGEYGRSADQRKLMETEDVLTAVVNGGEEPYVNLEYLEGIKWKRLWGGECMRLEGLGHAPFWESPELFEGLLSKFLGNCEGLKK
ncbi:alpha/beta-hydrolase [Dothidotthia symphoricarpi CBS 119687]|uniref:Alpha/beta-hydrolase n=1 Tax=Dothidotthia symphoricarpi CBS 119687 TaxID=1392245 RepID=A0A6A6AF75_9PLEO|nr:alpha/beta-hydrolase [Dothidotthia symphoricarpi CBS 119687]KAF2130622.1 alpha/beta-hydrolase [Dothidotthia symphoricarpi CBS 119687]